MLTKNEIQEAMPPQMRKNISQELVDHVNKWMSVASPEEAELYRDSLLTYSKVLTEGKYKATDYFAACMYVSYRSMGLNKRESWAKVFPDRYARLKANGKSEKDVSSHVAAYDATSLVRKIYDRSLTPVRVSHRDYLYRALKVSVDIMEDEDMPARDRVSASKNVMELLKDSETQTNKIELDVTPAASSVIDGLKSALVGLASAKVNQIENGTMSSRDSAHTCIDIKGEVVDE